MFGYGWNREDTDSTQHPMIPIRKIRTIRSWLFDPDSEPDSDTLSNTPIGRTFRLLNPNACSTRFSVGGFRSQPEG